MFVFIFVFTFVPVRIFVFVFTLPFTGDAVLTATGVAVAVAAGFGVGVALFAGAPHAIPRAEMPRTVESAITLFISFTKLLSFSKINLLLVLVAFG